MDVDTYIMSRVFCVINKPLNQWKGLYKPLIVPKIPQESISLYYLNRYPITKHKNDAILIVVDIFSKMDILFPF